MVVYSIQHSIGRDPTAGHIVFLARLSEEQLPAGSGGCNMRSSRSCSAAKNPFFLFLLKNLFAPEPGVVFISVIGAIVLLPSPLPLPSCALNCIYPAPWILPIDGST
uniref:Uncharacterized protein n=1 Tax=Morchella importuna TaxID=1174673 RepID=A0A650AF89_9PEZI|nr:hypothetical protein [Morchella importuna]QGN66696.1 hypothetical protein [Morchella importuna]